MIANADSRAHNHVLIHRHSQRGVRNRESAERASSALSIRTLDSYEAVLRHRELWNWPGTRDSDLDYFLYFARTRPEVIRPHVLVATRGETPEALLIGKLEFRHIPLQFGHFEFRSPQLRVLTFVYGGARGCTARDTTETLVAEVLSTLRDGHADVAVFEPVALNSQLFSALNAMPTTFGRGLHCVVQNHYRLQLPQTSQALQELLSSKQRRNYLRKCRKFVKDFDGDVLCRWHTSPSPGLYHDLEFVAARSHQRTLGVGFEGTPELHAWWEFASSKGWFRACILYAGGKPCAFWTGIVHAGILWGDYMAYDREWAPYSPGMQLLLRSLGEICNGPEQHGICEFNLGPGDSDLKALLSSSSKQESSIYLYPPTLLGALLNAMFSTVFLADDSARKWLARGSLLGGVARRLWRS